MKSTESMKLAISNIAFGEDQQAALDRVYQSGLDGIVVAPPTIWPHLPEITDLSGQDRKDCIEKMGQDAEDYSKRLGDLGLKVFGFQSLTYRTKGMSLFGSENERNRLAEHLESQAILAGKIGADSMSFGSPGLRNPSELSGEQAMDLASELLGRVATVAYDNGTQIAFEPLSGYGNKFVENLNDAMELANRVDNPGFGIHPDTAAMYGAKDGPEGLSLMISKYDVRGIDISAPELARLSLAPEIPQGDYITAIKKAKYDGWVSLEMGGPLDSHVIGQEIEYIKEQCGL